MVRRQGAYARVLGLASSQHGVVGRSQLLAMGLTEGVIRHWLASGHLLRVFRGTFVAGRRADRYPALWMAGVLRGGERSVLSGLSAAAAWKMVDATSLVQVARPRGEPVHETGLGTHSWCHLAVCSTSIFVGDVTSIGPVPVMSPARVLIDIARNSPMRKLRPAFLNAGHRGLLTRSSLEYCRTRGAAFKGHGQLMELVEQWQPGTGKLRSPLESAFLMLCGKHGISAPVTNFRIGKYEADCFWPGTRIVAELDSRTFHDNNVGFEDDREKGNDLSAAGYTVLRFTHRMIEQNPEAVVRVLRQHLGKGTGET